MPKREILIGSSVGLHARPAAVIVKAASSSGAKITIGRPGEKAINAASLLSIMQAGFKFGEKVEIIVTDHSDSERILNEIVDIVASDLDNGS